MSSQTTEIPYYRIMYDFKSGEADIFGKVKARRKDDNLKYNFQELSKEDRAKICVEIVEEWLTESEEQKEAYVRYVEDGYWLAVFQKTNCSYEYWENLFQNNDYRNVDVARQIPDDSVERLVFYFVYDWKNKFKILFLDSEVQQQQKVDVLRKQLDNILFIYWRRLQGNIWRMNSLPCEDLKQAAATFVGPADVDDDLIPQIPHRNVREELALTKSVVKALADGPKPDKVDVKLFNDVLKYAKATDSRNLSSWTLVRASFKFGDEDEVKEVRCYAFSGVSKDKKNIPVKWWKEHKFDDFYFKDNTDIFVQEVDDSKIGQNLVMSILRIGRHLYEKDLRELTELAAFGKVKEIENKIWRKCNNDLATLDYVEYVNFYAIKTILRYTQTITKSVAKVLKIDPEKLSPELFQKITCGEANQQFQPNENDLDLAVHRNLKGPRDDERIELVRKKTNIVKKISQQQLLRLKSELCQLPALYLKELKKILSVAYCGEDNVLPFLLAKLIENVSLFFVTRVEFVALDENNLDGKRFCERCNRKVRFFSILPSILSSLGVSGNDRLLKNLKELFPKLNTTQNNT